jgi:hypothetical protein
VPTHLNDTEKLKGYGLEPSYIIESGHGYHLYFVLDKLFIHRHSQWQTAQNALVDMAKGDILVKHPGALLRFPGTFNYKDHSNPKAVRIVSATGRVYPLDAFRKLTLDYAPKQPPKSKDGQSGHRKLGFVPPCINHLLDPSNKPPIGYRHQVRLNLAIFGYNAGWTIEDTVSKVMHTTDHPRKAELDVGGVYEVLETDPNRYSVGCGEGSSLRALVAAGIAQCDEKQCEFKTPKKRQEKQTKYSAWFDTLVDIVLDDKGKIAFLVKEKDSVLLKYEHDLPDVTLLPPPKNLIAWLLPRASEVMKYMHDNDFKLYEDLVNYHMSISDLADVKQYKFIAVWDMHTYLYNRFEYSPILYLYAIPARGKTRTAKGIIYVSWHGMHLPTIKEAHIIRLANDHKAVLFFDIMDFWKKTESSGADDIILNRFEKGGKVSRVLYPERGPFQDMVTYDVFGPTIIASNEQIHPILDTRCVRIMMPESNKTFNQAVREIESLPFRERLVAFRARWMDRPLPEPDNPASGRLGDILKPIRQIVNAVCPDEAWLLEFASQVQDLKKIESLDTDDAMVVDAILKAQTHVENGHLLHSHTLEIINRNRSDRYHMSPQRLGKITNRLGFKSYNSGDARGIYIDEELLNRLCQRYGIKLETAPLTF